MIERAELFPVGIVNKTHGVRGEIVITLDEDIDLTELRCIVFDMDGIFVPFFIASLRSRGASSVLVTLDVVENETAAATFTGKKVFALKEDISFDEQDVDPDNIYLEDLIGFRIFDTDGTPVGTVSGYDDSTENTLFTVTDSNGDNILVPAADDLIAGIDVPGKILTMNLPSGLI